jgi:GT2 family glycosyltransferase
VRLSIVIVNFRSWDCLDDCLRALGNTMLTGGVEIVVVDNCSADGRLPAFSAQFPQVRFVESQRNGGFAYGCNLGARHARGAHLLFMNPDVIAQPESVMALLGTKLDHPEIAILGACQLDGRGRLQKAFDVFPDLLTWYKSVKAVLRVARPARFPNPRRPHSGLFEVDWIGGSIVLLSRADFDRLGGWCEEFWMYAEDCDLCYRAWQSGMRVAVTFDVTFVHLHGGASRQTAEITAATKAETVVSKHVFIRRHSRGARRLLNHAIVASKTLLPLLGWAALDLLTLRRIGALRRRIVKLPALGRYYAGAPWTRGWRSHRVGGEAPR